MMNISTIYLYPLRAVAVMFMVVVMMLVPPAVFAASPTAVDDGPYIISLEKDKLFTPIKTPPSVYLANDTDPDGDKLFMTDIAVISGSDNFSISSTVDSATGYVKEIEFIPKKVGDFAISYKVTDGTSSSSAKISGTITEKGEPSGGDVTPVPPLTPPADSTTGGSSTDTTTGTPPSFDKLGNPLGGGAGGAGIGSVPELIVELLNVVMLVAVPLVALAIIYAGFLFVTALGNEEKLKKAKQTLWYVFIGAVIVLGALVIANAIGGTIESIRS